MSAGPLGRRPPSDWKHVDRWPLTATTLPTRPQPVVIGVSWYDAFDHPEQDISGKWWIGRGSNLGNVRGGHCVCLKPRGATDPTGWWDFYDQGAEGACVGFGVSRLASQLNRKRYDARWLYKSAQRVDEWPGEAYDGTSVRAGLDVLRMQGHRTVHGTFTGPVSMIEGISENRWARSIDDVLQVLGYQDLDFVDVLNSWGRSFPHITRLPASVLERLWREDGEVGIVVDR